MCEGHSVPEKIMQKVQLYAATFIAIRDKRLCLLGNEKVKKVLLSKYLLKLLLHSMYENFKDNLYYMAMQCMYIAALFLLVMFLIMHLASFFLFCTTELFIGALVKARTVEPLFNYMIRAV